LTAAVDNFVTYCPGLDSPPDTIADITPDDANDLAFVTRAIYVGFAGDIKITTPKGYTGVIPNVANGWWVGRVSRVWATGTTATGLKAGA
jgi:hypothetical protein